MYADPFGQINPNTTLGDFRTSALSPYATGKTAAALDYHYDVNGNLTRDLNKDIGSQTADGIVYNHLNLPWQISFRSATGTRGTITYIYDAAGNKLKKTTNDSAANLQTVTTYIGAFQYQGRQALGTGSVPADTLQFVGQPEGRIRLKTDTAGGQPVSAWKYDYFLKDHLGNTRMVLTDEQETDQYPAATMEVADSATENLYYTNLDETRVALPAGYPTDTTTKPNNYVAQLYSPDGNPVIGPGIVLKVMAGDRFSIRTSSWYQLNGTSPGTVVNPLTDIVSSMIAGVAHIPGESATAANLSGSPALSPNVLNFLTDTGTTTIDDSKPHAFLNWILFDNQFNYVAASSGYQQVGADGVLTPMTLMNLPVTSSGFLYIYTSNTTPDVAVLFDNLQVTHTRGPLLEEDHYYAYGLTMAGLSDRALKENYPENKYRFNFGSELQNKEFSDGSGLELYDAQHRMYDQQLGRFGQADALAGVMPYYSPYSFGSNDPITHIDPFGLQDTVLTTRTTNLQPVTVIGHQRAHWFYWPNSTPSDRGNWAFNRGLYHDRLTRGQDLSQKGDPVGYTASLPTYKRLTQVENDGRAMQSWAVGIIAAPALVGASTESLAYAVDFEVKKHIAAGIVDAALQTVGNAIEHKNIATNYNFLSGAAAFGIGVPEGASFQNVLGVSAFNATLGTSVNVSAASLQGQVPVLSFNPLSILIGTAFGTGAYYGSGAIGGGNLGDGLIAPFNVTGQAVDSGRKPKEEQQ